jgi:hypothetical protein
MSQIKITTGDDELINTTQVLANCNEPNDLVYSLKKQGLDTAKVEKTLETKQFSNPYTDYNNS